MSGDTTTKPLASGFGRGLADEGQGSATTKIPAIKAPKRKKRPSNVDPDSPAMDAINEAAGFSAPAVKIVDAKAPAKPKLPRIGTDPLNWTESEDTSQISIPGRTEVFDRFKAIREDLQQPGWVVLNVLMAHWIHNPPDGSK